MQQPDIATMPGCYIFTMSDCKTGPANGAIVVFIQQL